MKAFSLYIRLYYVYNRYSNMNLGIQSIAAHYSFWAETDGRYCIQHQPTSTFGETFKRSSSNIASSMSAELG